MLLNSFKFGFLANSAALLTSLFLLACTPSESEETQDNSIQLNSVSFSDVDASTEDSVNVTINKAFNIHWTTNAKDLYRVDLYLTKANESYSSSNRIVGLNCGIANGISLCPQSSGEMQCTLTTDKFSCAVGDKPQSSRSFTSSEAGNLNLIFRVCNGLLNECQIKPYKLSTTSVVTERETQTPILTEQQANLYFWEFDTDSSGWDLQNVDILNGVLQLDGDYEAFARVSKKGEYAMAPLESLDYDNFTVALRVKPEQQEKNTVLIAGGASRWFFLQQTFGGWSLYLNNYSHSFPLNIFPVFDGFNEIIINFDLAKNYARVTIDGQYQELAMPEGFKFYPTTKPSGAIEGDDCFDPYTLCDSGITFTNYSSGLVLKGEVDWLFFANGTYTEADIQNYITNEQ